MQYTAKFLLAVLLANTILSAAYAEFRIWTDKNGNAIEAEFGGVVDGNKISLTTRDGKNYKLFPSKLSPDDQAYLQGKIPDDLFNPEKAESVLDIEKPPRLDIKVNANSDSTSFNYDEVRQDVTLSITIEKASLQSYSKKMKAKLFCLGESKKDGNYVMLGKQEFEFDFIDTREVELEADMFSVQYDRSDKLGLEYKDYVIIVYDDQGKEITVEASSNRFRDARNKLDKFRRDDVFNKSFKKVGVRSGMGYYYQ